MLIWKEFYRPVDIEADLQMRDTAAQYVREKYDQESKGKLILWKDEEGYLGLIRINRSFKILASEVGSIGLAVCQPAKGPGHLSLGFYSSNENLLDGIHSRYSEKTLEWMRAFQKFIGDELGAPQSQIDLGVDV